VGRKLPGVVGKQTEAMRPNHGRKDQGGELFIFSHFGDPFSMKFYQCLMISHSVQAEIREIRGWAE
jgi:hypothetical protein